MPSISNENRTYRGGCHCGRIRYEVTGALTVIEVCNCSVCAKKAYLHWTVEREAFRLLTPPEDLTTYTFNTGVAKHHFCAKCGVASFYVPRSDPDKINVNVRCLEGVDPASLKIEHFDGRNWEANISSYKARRNKQEK